MLMVLKRKESHFNPYPANV